MLEKYEKEIPFLTGCTACACVIDTEKKKAYFANSGDSRAIIIKQITKDHKPDDKVEKERIYNEKGCVNDNRVDGILNLSRTIGDLKYKDNKKFSVDKQKINCTPDLYE
jgi:serine/threonine protein phosphatase PrpC